MPKISEERRQRQRQRIIDAAVTVLGERGFANASMAEIIRASGLSAGAIYGYFPSKNELFQAAARDVLGRRLRVLGQSATGAVPPPEEALVEFFHVLKKGEPGSAMIVQMWGEAVNNEGMQEVAFQVLSEGREAVEEYLVAWYTQEGAEGPERRARGAVGPILAMAQGALVQSALLGEPMFHLEEGLRRVLR
ncbi:MULTISPECIES: TetR/AcrR family transcriptional regulator [unclassified Corynebacterium]|uniref:TetR/AcrR family transcriptional regulator n=1 Tax=unclassified Corynebacterium TaxID=2624378 RepID=UPI0029C9CE55|nr:MULTISPECIES: TetR/AcrR family transcriptional regulator [unclassified Corynebacterium]WPF65854.1 TetR/AcrR family transcriptional regulator [Corynebacterium sp. 22KM0430]WPF68347.1 TetR/AcrR family transcriptional regulator [Corynebacterium sp. 21KM1197]